MTSRLAGMVVVLCLVMGVLPSADEPDLSLIVGDTALLRVFLGDGTSLVSFGEPARVGDRVVFSMPTSASVDDPQLHLVDLPADPVDWERTSRYADTVRAARYIATHAEAQYAALTAELGQALNDIALTDDPHDRLAIVERVRKTLTDWPARHFNYREAEIRRMLDVLDEAIADLRAAAGLERFDLSFVTTASPERPREPLLSRPTPKEAIEQTLLAARLSRSSAERVSLMSVALAAIERDAVRLPSDWRTAVRRTTRTAIDREVGVDRQYRSLTLRVMSLAETRARAADVRGIERLIEEIQDRDRALGSERPDTVAALLAAVDAHLDAARRLQLDRDRWALRVEEFRTYHRLVSNSMNRLDGLRASLEDIKSLAGSTPEALASIRQTANQVLEVIRLIVPPEEFRAVHTTLLSSAQLAASAADIRRQAALNADLARAWDASSAAAGAIMLGMRAKDDIGELLQRPQLPQ